MVQPIRFQHIGLTAQTSLTALLKLVALRDVRTILEALDEDIASLRSTLNPPGSPLLSIDGPVALGPQEGTGKYDGIDDVQKLERLVKAREKTKISLEGKVGWAGMEQASLEEKPGS